MAARTYGAARGVSVPRVTVCIPTYNRAAYLRESISSILGQTFAPFELVVSDNASSDDTADVVAAFADSRVSYERLDRNIGLIANHNRCLRLGRGEYVTVVPDDDLLRPTMLEETVRVLDEHPRVGLVHSAYDVVDAAGGTVLRHVASVGDGTRDTYETGREYIANAVSTSIRVHTSTALYRRCALPGVLFDQRDFPPVDLALMLRIALDWDVYFLARPLAAVRLHRDTFSASNGGTFTETGFIEEPEYIEKVKAIKLGFIAEHEGRLHGVKDLRRRTLRANTRSHVNAISRRTWPERRRAETLRLLLDARRREPRLTLESAAWKLLAASLLGPRIVDRVKRRRARRGPPVTVASR